MKDSTTGKFDKVRQILRGKRVLVAFSGGVDSTVLASLTAEVADSTKLLLITSPTVSKSEVKNAKDVAEELDLELVIKDFDWLGEESLVTNSIDRCFRCKTLLAANWMATAKDFGFEIVVEGTTASEAQGYRPGAKALEASDIKSPFLAAKITKDEIREFARERGLSVAERPSMACLATRFPYDTEINQERLNMVETVENAVKEIFQVECVRARFHDDLVRIEIGENELPRMFDIEKMKMLEQVARAAGFSYVTLDLRGYRTGAMDEGLDL
jgi:uncharacterized protein (TIGR00268 family)